MTNRQWRLVEPLVPPPHWNGRPIKHPRREIVNAILYMARAGGAWRMLPRDFPPWQTVYGYFHSWRADGTLDAIHDRLRALAREQAGRRKPKPTAGVMDSQSLRGADTVGAHSRGYDAGKRVNGRKRHIVTDTLGLLLTVLVTAASVQDRAGAPGLLSRLHQRFRSIRLIYADGGYAGTLRGLAHRSWGIVVAVVAKPDGQRGFQVLPRRWVVERTFSWLMRWRRLVRDYERLPATHEAWVKWSMIALMLNRLAPPPAPRSWADRRK